MHGKSGPRDGAGRGGDFRFAECVKTELESRETSSKHKDQWFNWDRLLAECGWSEENKATPTGERLVPQRRRSLAVGMRIGRIKVGGDQGWRTRVV
eukprot:9484409-Pyramimonas_sp.AAC.1